MNKRLLDLIDSIKKLSISDNSTNEAIYLEFCTAAYYYAINIMMSLQYQNSTLLYHLACSAEDFGCEFAMKIIDNKEQLINVYNSNINLDQMDAKKRIIKYIKRLSTNFIIDKYRKASHKVKEFVKDNKTNKIIEKEIWKYNFDNITSLDEPICKRDNTTCNTLLSDTIVDSSIDYNYENLLIRDVIYEIMYILSAKEQFAFLKNILGIKNIYLAKEVEFHGYLATYKKMLLQLTDSSLLNNDTIFVNLYYNKYGNEDFETSLSPSSLISKYSSIYKNKLLRYYSRTSSVNLL